MTSEYRPHPRARRPQTASADADGPPRGAPDEGPILGADGRPLGPQTPPTPPGRSARKRPATAIWIIGLVPLVVAIVTIVWQALK